MSTAILSEHPVTFQILLHSDGPALWPARFPESRLRQIEKTLGSYYFSALYGGTPSPEGGGYFKRAWFKYYERINQGDEEYYRLDGRTFARKHCRRFATVDLAFSIKNSADYTAIGAWGVTPDCDLILFDIIRERMSGDQLIPSIRTMVSKWNLDYTGIEDVQAQTLVVQAARKAGLAVRALKANMDKLTRSIPAQIRMESGQLWLPKQHQHLESLEHELLTFPQGGTDDLVDITSYAALEVQRLGGAVISEEERARLAKIEAEKEWQNRLERQRQSHADWECERFWFTSPSYNPELDESRSF